MASRVEVRLAATLTGWTSVLLAVVLAAFGLMVRDEELEGLAVGLHRELRGVRETVVASLPNERLSDLEAMSRDLKARGVSVRLTDADGHAHTTGSPWPAEAACVRAPHSVITAARVKKGDFLVRSIAAEPGSTLEAAVSLGHFVHERDEMDEILLATVLGGCAIAAAAAWVLAGNALAPLAAATRAIEAIDEDHLEARLPVRETNDLVDRHARAVNQVLSRLAWSFARIRAFSADAAHQLRTPVNRILNLAEVAALENATESERMEALTRMQDGALAMSRLVDSLLLLSRGEERRLRLDQSKLDLERIILPLAELYRPACEERSIQLIIDREPVQVNADAQLLSQCISNLLDNALRHSPDGRPLRISITRRGSFAVIGVEDSGPGIAAADRDLVFERFVQVGEERSAGHAGLGLPIARMIARLHHGDLSVRESDLGGACFEIALPLAEP